MIPNTQSLQHISSHNEFKKMTKTIIQSVAHSTICLTYRDILKKQQMIHVHLQRLKITIVNM